MYIRPYDEIYPPYYLERLSIEEARRMVERMISGAQSREEIIRWIYSFTCPYDREVVTFCVYRHWQELVGRCQEPAVYIDCDGAVTMCWMEYESELWRIVREAHELEVEEDMAHREANNPDCFCHFTTEAREEGLHYRLETELQKAWNTDAPTTMVLIGQLERRHYLDTCAMDNHTLYEALCNHFGKPHFTYNTMRQYNNRRQRG